MKTVLDKKEVTTILAALSYLRSNLDDATEALSDYMDATGDDEGEKPFLLTEEEIDNLYERINLGIGGTYGNCKDMDVRVVFESQ